MAVLRQLRRVHQVDPAAVPVPGRGAPRVPPCLPGLHQVQPQRRSAGVPVHGPRPQLLRPPLHRRRRPLTGRLSERLIAVDYRFLCVERERDEESVRLMSNQPNQSWDFFSPFVFLSFVLTLLFAGYYCLVDCSWLRLARR